ncbi:MAG: SpoVA/SpoVAEb family sporulation membrane protein [Clostridiales bacterium]|nr:SpoVA/SpoVAEb family sporulation membrane protein [Clostridiales bacterium]
MIFTYAKVFAVGGLVCALAQLLIIKTKLTPARILVIFLLLGILLESIGIYKPINEFAQAGISVPIIGFGASLARGSIEMARQIGFVGAFAGGLVRTAFGVGVAIVASYAVTLIFSPRSK